MNQLTTDKVQEVSLWQGNLGSNIMLELHRVNTLLSEIFLFLCIRLCKNKSSSLSEEKTLNG